MGLAVAGVPATPYQLSWGGNVPFNNAYLYYPARSVAPISVPYIFNNSGIPQFNFSMNNYGGAAGGVSYTLTFDLWGYYTS